MRKLLAVAVISGMLMLAPSGVAADPAGPGSERDTSDQTDEAAGVDPSDYEALRE